MSKGLEWANRDRYGCPKRQSEMRKLEKAKGTLG